MERALRCKVDAGQRKDTSSVSTEEAGQGMDSALHGNRASKEEAGQGMDRALRSKGGRGTRHGHNQCVQTRGGTGQRQGAAQ